MCINQHFTASKHAWDANGCAGIVHAEEDGTAFGVGEGRNFACCGFGVRGSGQSADLLQQLHPWPTYAPLTLGYFGPMNDPIYKRIFAFPRMVEDLLRGFAKGDWIAEADFSALQKAPAEYVGDDLRKRLGDSVWRLPLDGGWLHVLILLEFQSRSEPDMALRILEYTVMLYRELSRGGLGPDSLRPPVLPVVLYNGTPRWSAATDVRDLVAQAGPSLAPHQPSQRYLVVDLQRLREDDLPLRNLVGAVSRMERSRSPRDLLSVAASLQDWLRGSKDAELRRAFADWLWQLARHLQPKAVAADSPPPSLDLEDVRMTLDEMSLEERVAQWPKQWIQQGLEQGLERQRALLRRLATVRFGAHTADRAAELLEDIADSDHLEEIGELIVRCETGREFLARMDA